MSVWTTRSLDKHCSYIVLQHTLKGVNHTVNGIKFRDGYAVVEKGSKVYHALKKIPVLRACKEYPLLHLKKLAFITRTSDIRTVYGQDVYAKFLEEEQLDGIKLHEEKIQEKESNLNLRNEIIEEIEKAKEEGNVEVIETLKSSIPTIMECCYRKQDETLCRAPAVEYSPSNYCANHLIEEPTLASFGIEKPSFMTKKERRDFRDKVSSTLQKAKRDGKF